MQRSRVHGIAGGGVLLLILLAAMPAASGSPVADAVMRGNTDEVVALLEGGADVNAPQGDGMTALHWAAELGDGAMTDLLLGAGADVAAVTRLGDYTPLHLASRVGALPVVKALLEAGADATARTSTGDATPLHFAAAAGNPAVVAALLAHGADPDAVETAQGQTPLMFAASYDRTEAIAALLAGGADPSLESRVTDVAARAVADRKDRALRNQRMQAGAQAPERTRAAQAEPLPTPEQIAQREDENRQIEEPEPLTYGELVGGHGGLTALLHAARGGHADAVRALLDGGADIDQVSGGDHTSPMLIAMINGHFDLAMELLDLGADPSLASDAGATPLYAVLNAHWAPKSRYPQQQADKQQKATYLEVMKRLLEAGVDPDVRLKKHLWYMSYNFDLLQVDTEGATPFWRAAYATDVEAMKLLVAYGADPNIPTVKVPEDRRRRQTDTTDYSGLPPIPVGGPGVYPIHAASGVGYGQGFAANSHRHVPDGWLPAVRYLVEELGADVNLADHNGYTALHHAASRGDNELIEYLVSQGADVTRVSRRGQTTADMANGPYQRTQPFPETVALLERLGAVNNHRCVSC